MSMNAPSERPPSYSYAMALDLQGHKALVVGGGQVALRKVKRLLEAKAEVTVIAPEIHAHMPKEGVAFCKRPFRQEDVAAVRPTLCMAATDSKATNEAVASACRQAGVLVNVCDDSAPSDFIVPAQFVRGDLMVAVSTNGKNPQFSRQMRQLLEEVIDPSYSEALEVAAQLREEILTLPIPQDQRADLIRQIRIKDLQKELQAYSKAALIERMRGCLFSS